MKTVKITPETAFFQPYNKMFANKPEIPLKKMVTSTPYCRKKIKSHATAAGDTILKHNSRQSKQFAKASESM